MRLKISVLITFIAYATASQVAWDALKIAGLSLLAPFTVPVKMAGVSLRCRAPQNQNFRWCNSADGCEWHFTKDGNNGKCRSAGFFGLRKAFQDRGVKCATLFPEEDSCTEQPDCKWQSNQCTSRLSHFMLNTRREIHAHRSTEDRNRFHLKKISDYYRAKKAGDEPSRFNVGTTDLRKVKSGIHQRAALRRSKGNFLSRTTSSIQTSCADMMDNAEDLSDSLCDPIIEDDCDKEFQRCKRYMKFQMRMAEA